MVKPSAPAQFFRLKALTAFEVFDLLTPYLQALPADLRVLAGRNIGIVIDTAQTGLSADVICAEYLAETETPLGQFNATLDGLRQRFGELTRRPPAACESHEFERASALLGGLAGLVLAGHELCHDVAARVSEGEYLLVSEPGLSMDAAATLFGHLAVQSTAVRWSVFSEENRWRYLFSGISQLRRGGNAESVLPLIDERYRRLRGCGVDGFTVFLPERLDPPILGRAEETLLPGAGVLLRLKELLAACPELLPSSPAAESGDILLAMIPQSGPSRELQARLLAVPQRCFHRNFFLDPAYQRIKVDVQGLQFSQTAHDAFRSHLSQLRDCDGYQLELHDTEAISEEINLEHVRQQRDYWNYRYDLLCEARRQRPTLMRFSHDQLPELARLLREMPLATLFRTRPLYGCSIPETRSPTSPVGASPISELAYHYLYFESGWTELADLQPLLRYASDCERAGNRSFGRPETMRFWLDPFWAQFYPDDEANRCLVFVPEGQALFPTMHGWNAAEMDRYLRDVLNELVSSEQRQNFGKQPIYLFDGPFGSGSERICITLLDLAEFVPFQARLGWVNDHLDILDALDVLPDRRAELTRRIAEMATQARWDAIHEELLSRGQPAQARLHEAAAKAHAKLTTSVRDELSVFDRQLEEAFGRLRGVHERARQLNEETEELRQFLKQAELARDEMRTAATQLDRDTSGATTQFDHWEQAAATLLERLESGRVATEEQVHAAAERLEETRRRIREFLRNLK
ncbi:MAG: hypothetical protein ACKV2Q_05755 [Planctomycetaceae bacterium]